MTSDDRLARHGNALILVVERDPHVQELERFFLEEAGFHVEFADDGVQGLKKARTLLPDIIVSEILLPRLDGLTICRTLKADPTTRHILVLVFSILAAEERAREAGADGYLRKPLDDAVLVRSVADILARRSNEGGADAAP